MAAPEPPAGDAPDDVAPVDIIVIGFPVGAPMTGEAVPLLQDLVRQGIIRLLDVLLVAKDADGTVTGLDAQGLDAEHAGDFHLFRGTATGLIGDADMAEAAQALEPGTAAVLIAYENRWAAPFVSAVRRNGGVLLVSQRIGAQDVAEALAAAGRAGA